MSNPERDGAQKQDGSENRAAQTAPAVPRHGTPSPSEPALAVPCLGSKSVARGGRTLEEIARELGPDELRVLKKIAERLAMGQKQYGRLRLAHDRRDFRKEAAEEAFDLAVYLACEIERPK